MKPRGMGLGPVALVVVVLALALGVSPVAAQTPTPEPPVTEVIATESGSFVLEPRITYGEAGIMIGLVIVAALLLLRVGVEVVSWLLR